MRGDFMFIKYCCDVCYQGFQFEKECDEHQELCKGLVKYEEVIKLIKTYTLDEIITLSSEKKNIKFKEYIQGFDVLDDRRYLYFDGQGYLRIEEIDGEDDDNRLLANYLILCIN
jgi:hypothetical protein